MKEKHNRKITYNSIICDAQGKAYLINESIIKEEQCYCCKNRNNIKNCRFDVKNGGCINYEKMDKRKC